MEEEDTLISEKFLKVGLKKVKKIGSSFRGIY